MKVIKNTSGRSTAELRKLICRTHSLMKRLEKKPAPNWKRLRIKIQGRNENYHTGRAYFGGNGYYGWDIFLTLPRPIVRQDLVWDRDGKHNRYTARSFVKIVYHELMHTYGYHHNQFEDISQEDLEKLVPENYNLPAEPVKTKKATAPAWRKKYDQAVAAEKRWMAKQKRAATALKKARKKIKYYESKYATV